MYYYGAKQFNFLQFLKDKTSNFFYSYFYPIILSLVVFLFWVANLQFVALAIVVLTSCIILLTQENLILIIPQIFTAGMCFRDTTFAFTQKLVESCIFFGLFFLCLFIHFIKYPVKKFKLDNLFYAMLLVFLVYLLTYFISPYLIQFPFGMDLFCIAGLVPILIHLIFYNKIQFTSKIDVRKFLCVVFICATNLACAQLICVRLQNAKIINFIIAEASATLGWANQIHIANIILISIPLCCYMVLDAKHPLLWIIQIVILFVCMYFSYSDGCFATLLAFTPILMVYTYKYATKRNKAFLKTIYVLMTSAIILLAIYSLTFYPQQLLQKITKASSGTGRYVIHEFAISLIKENPVFGTGLNGGTYLLEIFQTGRKANYHGFYHSTLFQLLVCCGILGVIAYIIYYGVRLKCLAKNNTVLGTFAILAFCMFTVYAMVDNSEFNIVLLYMTTMITAIDCINKYGKSDMPLPLKIKKIKFNKL